MAKQSTTDREATEVLTAVVRVLQHAAVQAWSRAEAAGPMSHLHLFALGVQSATAEAVALLPPGVDIAGPVSLETDPVLLRAVEALTRTVKIHDQPLGFSALVITLCDLVREGTE